MHINTYEVLYWIVLGSIPGAVRVTIKKLVKKFGSPEGVLSAPQEELQAAEGVSRRAVEAIRSFAWREHAESQREKAVVSGVSLVTLDSPAYPGNLRKTPDPPLYLYIQDMLKPEDASAVAIVGTCKPTYYRQR